MDNSYNPFGGVLPEDSTLPSAFTSSMTPADISKMQGLYYNAILPPKASFGNMEIDPNAYKITESGTPWDIIRGGLRERDYRTDVADAKANKAKYEEAVSTARQSAVVQAEQAKQANAKQFSTAIQTYMGSKDPEVQAEAMRQALEVNPSSLSFFKAQGKSDVARVLEALAPTKPTTTKLQEGLTTMPLVLNSSEDIKKRITDMPKEMFQVEGLGVSALKNLAGKSSILTSAADKLDVELADPNRPERVALTAKVQKLKSDFLKSQSGLAVTESEAKRLDQVLPIMEGFAKFDSKPDAISKIDEFIKITQAIENRYNYLLTNGFARSPTEAKDIADKFPLETFMDGAPTASPTQPSDGRVVVKSVQEANALPKGTVFYTPDGKRKVR